MSSKQIRKLMRQNINSGLLLFEQDISRSKCPVNVTYAQEKITFSLGVRLYGNLITNLAAW